MFPVDSYMQILQFSKTPNMKNALRWTVLVACFGSSWTLPVSLGAKPSTVIAVPSPLKKFMPSLHLEKLKEAKESTIDFVMIGDSITHAWSKYPEAFAGSNALNLGVPGDRTQNVLWRIRNGAVDGLSPKLVTLMIGTNNLHDAHKAYPPDDPKDIFFGVQVIVNELQQRLPDSQVVIFSIFPRKPGPANERVKAVNAMLPQLADGKRTDHINLNRFFSTEKGQINRTLYKNDLLHLNDDGYRAWATALKPLLEKYGLRVNLNSFGKRLAHPLPASTTK